MQLCGSVWEQFVVYIFLISILKEKIQKKNESNLFLKKIKQISSVVKVEKEVGSENKLWL